MGLINVLDRAIGVVMPETGLRRAAARFHLDQLQRSYDGAMVGRRTANWRANNASANVSIKGALPLLRARSRDIMRNTWWGARIKSTFTAHAVGTGITPKFDTGNKTLDRKARAAWKKWGKKCDAEGQLSINGLIALACDCMIESGEVLARLKSIAPVPGRVPLEIQLLEPDHLDISRDRMMSNTAIVDQGVEYNIDGKRTAYWILPVHPGARGLVMPSSSIKVNASEVLHLYRKVRIGQGRGVPWVAPILLKGRDVADLEEAVVIKSRIEACLAAFIKTTNTGRTLANQVSQDKKADGSTRRIETWSPGSVNYLEQGEELQTVAPSASVNFESVLKTNFMMLAAGAGITYDQMTGDLSNANYSSLRAGKIEFRRLIEQIQHLTIVDMFLDPLVEIWTERAMDAGVLPRRVGGYPCEWIMPANEPIDPLKDMQADILAVRSGRMTWAEFVGSWGLDPDTQLDQIEAWLKDLDKRGVVLDCDPRRALAGIKGAPKTDVSDDEEQNVKTPKAK